MSFLNNETVSTDSKEIFKRSIQLNWRSSIWRSLEFERDKRAVFSESLSTLEVFVHVNRHPEIINQYDLYCIELPDALTARLEEEDLPIQWRAIPFSENTQPIGNEFLTLIDGEFYELQVPSVISPRDNNYVINPNHSAIMAVFESAVKLDFEFDPRIFK